MTLWWRSACEPSAWVSLQAPVRTQSIDCDRASASVVNSCSGLSPSTLVLLFLLSSFHFPFHSHSFPSSPILSFHISHSISSSLPPFSLSFHFALCLQSSAHLSLIQIYSSLVPSAQLHCSSIAPYSARLQRSQLSANFTTTSIIQYLLVWRGMSLTISFHLKWFLFCVVSQ